MVHPTNDAPTVLMIPALARQIGTATIRKGFARHLPITGRRPSWTRNGSVRIDKRGMFGMSGCR